MKRLARHFFFSSLFLPSFSLWGNPLEEFLRSPHLEKGHIGIALLDCKTGTMIAEHQSDRYFVPASLTKIPLTFCALETLGPDYRYKTVLGYEGVIEEGVLKGCLFIKGGGDPTLNADVLDHWKEVLTEKGIATIAGAILVDDTIFETAMASPYWNYQDIGNYYGAGASGLTFHENYYSITFKPGEKLGDPATVIKTTPPLKGVHAFNEVTTGEAGTGDQVTVFGSEYFMTQYYRGTVPIDVETLTIKAALPDPALFCGIQMAEQIPSTLPVQRVPFPPEKMIELDSHLSPPLKNIIKIINTKSHNLYAEHLLKSLGNGQAAKGLTAFNNFLKVRHIDGVFYDAAGVARVNMITPKAMVALLYQIKNSKNSSLFIDSLAERNEGTLDFIDSLGEAEIRAKTGTLCKVFNLSGYLTLANGREVAFCIMCNNINHPILSLKEDINRLIKKIVNDL